MLFLILLAGACSVALAAPKGGQCYDCNYAPDGIIKKSNGTWAATKNDVFHHCALQPSDDDNSANYVNKRDCINGRCFVRKDDNGMVFRGCADQWNLPWAIDTSKSCEQQSYQGSVWFFCDGSLCNNVDIEAECGDVPVKTGREVPAARSQPEVESGFDPDHEVSMGDPVGGALYAYPIDPPQKPGFETVHGQDYSYWKDPPARKRRPINRKSNGYQTRQTGPQNDDVYYSRISGQPVAAEPPLPEVYYPVPQPESPPDFVSSVIEETPIIAQPEPEQEAYPGYEAGQNSWWNYFPFNYYKNQQGSSYPFQGYFHNMYPWQASYASQQPKQVEPKPVETYQPKPVETYQPNPKRTEINIIPAKIVTDQTPSTSYQQKSYPQSWSESTGYNAPQTNYRAPDFSYKAPEVSYKAPEVTYGAPKVTRARSRPLKVFQFGYAAPSYVAPEPAEYAEPAEPAEPARPAQPRDYQTNNDPHRTDYYADKRHTDTGYDRPYVYFAERNDPYEPADERGQTRLEKRANDDGNPCNDHCIQNPTQLLADPGNPNGFIQCGSGFRNSGACECCVPYYHQCPRGTEFDDVIKICGLGREVNRGEKRYSAVEY